MKNRVEIREQDYCAAMEELRFSEEAKAGITQRLISAGERPVKVARPLRRVVVVAACFVLVAVLAVGAGAAGGVKPLRDLFTPILGGNVAQTEIIDKVGRPIGASATNQGITISADAILGDRYNACIVYTLTREDGSRFLPEGVRAKEVSILGGAYLMGETGSSYCYQCWDDDPEDNEITVAQMINGDGGPLEQGEINAWFQEIYYYPKGDVQDPDSLVGIEPVSIAKGSWKMRFEVAYEDSSLTLSQGETTETCGLNCTMWDVAVSPFAVTAFFTTDSDNESGMDELSILSADGSFLRIRKTDGTEIPVIRPSFGYSPEERGGNLVTESGFFPEIIPLEEIESVIVGDIVYPVNP